jgi:zinc transporter, ZIP family
MLDAMLPAGSIGGGGSPARALASLSWPSAAAVHLALSGAVRAVLAPVRAPPPGAPLAPGAMLAGAAQIRENFPLALLLSLLAGASTGLGGLLVVAQARPSPLRLGAWQGAAAGLMCAMCFCELLPSVGAELEAGVAAFYVTVGGALFLLLKRYIPEPDLVAFNPGSVALSKAEAAVAKQVLLTGWVTAVGLFLHNAPEGIAVGLSSLQGVRVSLPLAVSIALHNAVEGAVIATPVYFATLDKSYAVRLSFYSGMAEPLGVAICYAVLYWTGMVLTNAAVAALLGAVAGVMLSICFLELLPQAREQAGAKGALASAAAGMATMSALLWILDWAGVDKD